MAIKVEDNTETLEKLSQEEDTEKKVDKPILGTTKPTQPLKEGQFNLDIQNLKLRIKGNDGNTYYVPVLKES